MYKTTILLVDDHQLVREGLKQLLNTFENVDVVGEAGDGYEAISVVQELEPDIVIMDISMPKMRGVEAVREIKRLIPDIKILVLSMHDREEYIKQTLENGAAGYLLKQSASEELKTAIKAVMNDKVYISPNISKQVVKNWLTDSDKEGGRKKSTNLSNREIEVLKLLAEGFSNKQIAEFLFISIKTVETHRHRIMEKLELDNFAALVKYAIKEKIIELG